MERRPRPGTEYRGLGHVSPPRPLTDDEILRAARVLARRAADAAQLREWLALASLDLAELRTLRAGLNSEGT